MTEKITYEPRPVPASLEIKLHAQAGENWTLSYRPKGSILPWTRIAQGDPKIPEIMRLAGWGKRDDS